MGVSGRSARRLKRRARARPAKGVRTAAHDDGVGIGQAWLPARLARVEEVPPLVLRDPAIELA